MIDFKNFNWLKFLLLTLFCAIVFCFFLFNGESNYNLEKFIGKVNMKGCVEEEPDIRDDHVKYVLSGVSMRKDESDSWERISEKILVNAERYPVFEYGDCFSVFGQLKFPEKILNFDYEEYLAMRGISAILNFPKQVQIYDRQNSFGAYFFRFLNNVKSVFRKKLSGLYGEPYGSFLDGLLLGGRRGVPDDLMEAFRLSGLTHILAISGYNIALIIAGIYFLFGFLSRRKRVIVSIFFVVIFIFFVGATASVVRAGIMGTIGLISIYFGRQNFAGRSLMISGLLMVLFNTKTLNDVGFQLSFLATFGIIYVYPILKDKFSRLPDFFGIRETFLVTMSAQITVVPILIYHFGNLSLIAPLMNLIVLPLIPFVMMFGFVSLVISFFSGFLAMLVSFPAYFLMKGIIFLLNTVSKIDIASIDIEFFPLWIVILYYVLILIWLKKKRLSFF